MTRPTKTLLLLAAVALLGGCKSGPAMVCDKLDDLAAKAMTDGDEASKKIASSMLSESSTCLTRMQAMEQKDAQLFARATTCIEGATEIRGAVQCFFTAAMGDKAVSGKSEEPAAKK